MKVETSFGTVIILLETAVKFEFKGVPVKIAFAKQDETYLLIWRTNGDWQTFIDGAEMDSNLLDGWEPEAIWQANEEIIDWLFGIGADDDYLDDVLDDLDYYEDWASAAAQTLTDDNK